MAFTAAPVWDLIMMILLVVACAAAVLFGCWLGQVTLEQACGDGAVGEQSAEILPWLTIDCPA